MTSLELPAAPRGTAGRAASRVPYGACALIGLFDLFGGYRALFLLRALYTALAFAAVLRIPRGAGEADTGAADAPDVMPGVA